MRDYFGDHGQKYSSYEARRLLEYNAFWIQDKKKRMFGCINYNRRYSEKPLSKTLFVVVYHKKRFVPIGPKRLGGCVTVSCLNAIKKYDIASEIALMLPKVTDKDGGTYLRFRTLKLRH